MLHVVVTIVYYYTATCYQNIARRIKKPLINFTVVANCVNPYTQDLPCAARNAHICLNMLRFLRCYSLHFIHHNELVPPEQSITI